MISLTKVTKANLAVMRNLFQFFCHDLAACDEPMPMANGRYVVERFSVYHAHPGLRSFLIDEGGRPLGFIVVSVPPYFMSDDSHCVQHLFVLNGHRRRGVATEATARVFGQFPGRYRVGQPINNRAAIEFWRTVYARRGIEVRDGIEGARGDEERVQRFEIR